tara:strand:- start:1734 stop:2447 length:714 start_codon:yes stop_codon:yes gene_type:complete
LNKKIGNIALLLSGAIALMDCSSAITIQTQKQIDIQSSTKNSESILKIIEPYQKELALKMDIEIAKSEANYIVERPCSNLMNWMADAVFLNQTKNSKLSYPIFCLLNTGGIRASLGIGPVTLGDIYKLMPFDNSIVWVKLPIKELSAIESYITESGGEPISNIYIKNGRIEFKGFDRSKATEFWVITSDYLLSGGDRMDFFQKGTEIIHTNILIRDALIEEVKIQGVLINDERKRIK